MLDPHIPTHMKKRIDSIKKEGRLRAHDFPNILEYEKFLNPDEILGSEGNFNFLWTNDSWHHYAYYTIEGDIEEHIEQMEGPSIDEDNGSSEDSHENYVFKHREKRWDSYSEYNEIYDEPDLIDDAVEKGEKAAYEAQRKNEINEKSVDKILIEEKTYSGITIPDSHRKWIKLSEILKPEPEIIINDDIPF